jgi:hypothetical protein
MTHRATLTLYVGDVLRCLGPGDADLLRLDALRPSEADQIAEQVNARLRAGRDVSVATNCANLIDRLVVFVDHKPTLRVVTCSEENGRVQWTEEQAVRFYDTDLSVRNSEALQFCGVWT